MNSQFYKDQMAVYEGAISDYNSKLNTANSELTIVQNQIKLLGDFLSKVQKSKLELDLTIKDYKTISSYLEHVILQGKPFDKGDFENRSGILNSSSTDLGTVIEKTNAHILRLKSKETNLKNDINTYISQISINQTQYEGAKYNYGVQFANEENAKAEAIKAAQQKAIEDSQRQTSAPSGYTTSAKSGGTCFQAGTKIIIKNGYKNIEDIEVGDLVLSYNTESKHNEYKKVTKIIIHENTEDELYTLFMNDYSLNVTGSHRFYINDKWIEARYLKANDKLLLSNGDILNITNINHIKYTDNYYNIEVEDNHNYYVSEKEILVHNAKMKIA